MATFISLVGFTDKGIQAVRQTVARAEAFKVLARSLGVTVKEIFWTVGLYDLVIVMEAPDEETVSALALTVGALGNVRTQTLRGFSAEEMNRIIAKMPPPPMP